MSNDQAYDNSGHVPGSDAYPPRWEAEALAFRHALGPRAVTNWAYGDNVRQVFDLFMPEDPPKGLMVFVHGGYWRRFAPGHWSAFAQGGLDAGWAVAMPGYTLAPEARISRITREIVQALSFMGETVPGPIRLCGHSAGGHLVARMLCADAMLPAAIAARIEACVPISPVGDLRPLIDTAMNEDLRLTDREAAGESPTLLGPGLDVPMTVWVGGAELPAFVDQARDLARAWNAPCEIAEGRHHFDVIDDLKDRDSALMRAILG